MKSWQRKLVEIGTDVGIGFIPHERGRALAESLREKIFKTTKPDTHDANKAGVEELAVYASVHTEALTELDTRLDTVEEKCTDFEARLKKLESKESE